ncbi:hypothetical protein ACIRPK_11940 [Kitasatospora sp. NPDC101801]|uniref:hypothetical protein n=1 Tax=Kitasatospora sp. NPDC101801 TaxID=3364103 RepID=UPI0038059778
MNYPVPPQGRPIGDSGQLVLGPFPVTRGDRGTRPVPTRATVFSGGSGDFQQLDRLPSYWQAGRYSHRYDVDLSDHRVSWQEQLESATPGFRFHATMHAIWRVADPAMVVRRGVNDSAAGDAVVRQELNAVLRNGTRRFPVQQDAQVQQYLESSYGGKELPLAQHGLTVASLILHVGFSAETESIVKAPTLQNVELDQLHGRLVIEQALQEGQAKLLGLRAEVIKAAASQDNGLLVYLIAQNQGDLRSILQEASNQAQLDNDRKLALFNSLVEQKYIQPADVQEMWQTLMRTPTGQTGLHALPGTVPPALPTVALPPQPAAPPAPWENTQAGAPLAPWELAPPAPPAPAAPTAPAPGTEPEEEWR